MPVIDRLAVEVGADLAPLRQAFAEAEHLTAATMGDLGDTLAGGEGEGLFDGLAQGVASAARTIGGTLADALAGAEVAWDQVIGRMARRLSDLALDAAFNQVLDGALGSGTAGALGGLFGGFRAAGGPVAPGRAYVVGEAGPELFVPGLAGTVLPQAPAPMPTVIVNISTPDAASFRQSQGQVAAAVGRALTMARRYS